MTQEPTHHTARLDQRTLDLLNTLSEDDAAEIQSGLAFIRETWDGSEGEDQSPAEAFRTIAAYAEEIAKRLETYEEAQRTVRPGRYHDDPECE